MLLLAADDAFALQGPRPEIPAGFADTYWVLALIFLVVLGAAGFAVRALWRRRRTGEPPRRALLAALAEAEADGGADPTRVIALTAALRAYLAATDARAGAALSTDELDRRLAELPVFVPARAAVTGVLRAADAAKFAGAPLPGALIVAGVRDILGRVEDARRLLGRAPR